MKTFNATKVIELNAEKVSPAMDMEILKSIVNDRHDIFDCYESAKVLKVEYRNRFVSKVKGILDNARLDYSARAFENALGKRNPIKVLEYGDRFGRPMTGIFINGVLEASAPKGANITKVAMTLNEMYNKYAEIY